MHAQLRCEVCGRKIHGKPFRVMIEGAKLTVCSRCSRHGKIIWKEEPSPRLTSSKTRTITSSLKIQPAKTPETKIDTSLELVEGFEARIRNAREKLGLSHEDLGKKISEKVSVLKKIESGKMTPDNKLAAKLEHALKIKLLVPTSEEKLPKVQITKPAARELTLGDLIQLNTKNKKKEDKTERKPS